MLNPREQRIEIFEDTMKLCNGNTRLAEAVKKSISGTKFYSADGKISVSRGENGNTKISVTDERTFQAAKRLCGEYEGKRIAVLNFASATNPGGGVTKGSSAQEEALCRATTLSRSLFQFFKPKSGKKDRYAVEANISLKDIAYPMDMNFGGIYSPGVTVFRNSSDLYSLMEENDVYKVGIISVAALDFNEKHGKNLEYKAEDGGFTDEGLEIMKNKIRTIYRLALANGHDSLVAGAFGCGAFRLPSETVAALFNEILSETEFRNKFRKITFAILDKDGEDGKFAPFYKLFNR